MTYIRDVLTGKAKPEQIDDYIEKWHDGDGDGADKELHEYLGLTFEDFGMWVQDSCTLPKIISKYQQAAKKTTLFFYSGKWMEIYCDEVAYTQEVKSRDGFDISTERFELKRDTFTDDEVIKLRNWLNDYLDWKSKKVQRKE